MTDIFGNRVPGNLLLVNKLEQLFDAGGDIDLRTILPIDLDPHVVGSLFKLWLRESELVSRAFIHQR